MFKSSEIVHKLLRHQEIKRVCQGIFRDLNEDKDDQRQKPNSKGNKNLKGLIRREERYNQQEISSLKEPGVKKMK